MEQFLYGLLAGVALGMWLAILLYTFAGRRQQRLAQRRRQARDAQLSARERYGRPADDFDDYYEHTDAEQDGLRQETVQEARVPARAANVNGDDLPAQGSETGHGDTVEEGEPAGQAEAEEEDEAYLVLMDMLDGDTAAVERLIEYERERAPAAPRAALVRNALDRLDYSVK